MKAVWFLFIPATRAVNGWVNVGSQEQARGMEQISRAIPQMQQVTQKTAGGPTKRQPARTCRRMPPTCGPWCTKCGKWREPPDARQVSHPP